MEKNDFNSIEFDNAVKLEKYYSGRKLRYFVQLLEIAETICRSTNACDNAKIVAKGFANHYRRMVMCIAMKPFNPDSTDEWDEMEKIYTSEVARLNGLIDPDFHTNK